MVKKKVKKRKTKRKKKIKDPLFYVARTSSVKVNDGDSIDVRVICPSCQTYWADAKVVFGGHITPESIKPLEPYKESCRVEPGKPLVCPACSFRYTNWAVMALIVSTMRRKDVSSNFSGNFQSFGKS